MSVVFCVMCDHEMSLEKPVEMGQAVICPQCFQQYRVLSLEPLDLELDENGIETAFENPEKLARVRRMERKSKADFEDDEQWDDEFSGNGKYASHGKGKRTHSKKRLRGYNLDDAFFDD